MLGSFYSRLMRSCHTTVYSILRTKRRTNYRILTGSNFHLAELGHEKKTTTFKAISECLAWPTNATHVPSANGSTKSYRKISMPDAPATADYFEDQLPPVVPLDVSLHLLHPCCGCVAVTLSVSILLTVHWLAEILRLTAMDGRSIDLAAHQKGTFFSIGN